MRSGDRGFRASKDTMSMKDHAKDHGCHVQPVQAKRLASGTPTVAIRLLVGGMGCDNCAMRVRNALVRLDGVELAHVSVMPPIASVRYDPTRVTPEDLMAAVAGAGAYTRHRYIAAVLPS